MKTHRQRYDDLVTSYISARNEEPNRNWRAFLWLATTLPHLWDNHVATFVDMTEDTVDFERLLEVPLSSYERRLMEAARSLYAGEGLVDLSDLAVLDEVWTAVVQAVELYRSM